jgi:hypothetical protein
MIDGYNSLILLAILLLPVTSYLIWYLINRSKIHSRLLKKEDSYIKGVSTESPLLKVDEMLKTAKVDQTLLDNLGKGLTNLAESASKMKESENKGDIIKISKELVALDSVYELELLDAKFHESEMQKFNDSLTKALATLSKIENKPIKRTNEWAMLMEKIMILNQKYNAILSRQTR